MIPKMTIFLIFLVYIGVSLAQKSIRVDKDHFFKDEFDRIVVLHGVNIMNEDQPYLPNTETKEFNVDDSLVDEDFELMKSWGIRFIRLYVSWEAAEPQKTRYNEEYFQKLVGIVKMAGRHDVKVILSVHQDMLSRRFCGRGFPAWAFEFKDFPAPNDYRIRYDYETQMPLYPEEDCAKYPRTHLYVSQDIIRGFSDLFTGKRGLHIAFANLWKTIAKRMSKEPNVLGYEIINEVFENTYFTEGVVMHWKELEGAENVNEQGMMKLIEAAAAKIREVDPERWIIYPPLLEGINNQTLVDGPNEAQFPGKSVYAYHMYCVVDPLNPFHEYTDGYMCKGRDIVIANNKIKSKLGNGNAAICTEFGSLSHDHRKHEREIAFILNEVDSKMHWRAFFQYKRFNQENTTHSQIESLFLPSGPHLDLVRIVATPYFYAVCGEPLGKYGYDQKERSIFMRFKVQVCKNGAVSELYMNRELTYPNGYLIWTDECPGCEIVKKEGGNGYEYILKLSDPRIVPGRVLTFLLTPDEDPVEGTPKGDL